MNRFIGGRLALVAALACTCTVAQADDEKKEGWSGNAGLGYLAASGNADNVNANALVEVFYDWEQWHHLARATGTGAQADGVGSAERYTLDLKTQRDFSEFDYLFGLIAYQKDRFAGVREQLSETVGYGRRLINNDTHILNVEAGVGFRQIDFQDGTDDSGAIVRLGSNYRWNFSETARFDQSIAIEAGSDNTSTESISAVTAKLLGAMDLVVSFTIKNNSDVPVGTTSTDRFTSISLQYGW